MSLLQSHLPPRSRRAADTTTTRPGSRLAPLVILATVLALPAGLLADEGMWLLDQPPRKILAERYDFTAEPAWYRHLQRSAVRWPGGSGSLVSADGLVMTNYHVAVGQIGKLSTAEHDLMKEGFLARERADELPCPDLELKVLWEIEDVTAQIKAAVSPEMSAAAAEEARRTRRAELESTSEQASGLASEVVTLYGGGLYHLYRYQRFTDVRLVMAPEMGTAFFGGDADNFEFPRYNFDVAFLRLYRDGEPWHPEHFLRFDRGGAEEGDLLFAVGHPARTQRSYTLDHLRFLRDVAYPSLLAELWRREVGLELFSRRDAEHRRLANQTLLGAQNGRKSIAGKLRALQDPRIFARKAAEESELRRRLAEQPELEARWGGAWDAVARSQANYAQIYTELQLLERRPFRDSRLFAFARSIVRWIAERQRPSGERLAEYRDSAIPSLELSLYSSATLEVELERHALEQGLAHLAELLGGEDPRVVTALAGLSPADRARSLVEGTSLVEVEARRALVAGGPAAVAASDDPLIMLARQLDPSARALRQRYDDEVESLERQAYDQLAAARFAVLGDNVYPDASRSLRLSFGRLASYQEDGQTIGPSTDLAGLYAHGSAHAGEPFFDLPARWLEARPRLALDTPFNFVSTLDIIGGSSGSPIIDREGRLVGIVFDGNRHSFAWDSIYDDRQGRTLGVDSRAIVEILRQVYGADRLLDELLAE